MKAAFVACSDGTELHYSDRAAEAGSIALAPLVLCHGLLSTRQSWDGVVGALPSDRRVVSVDLPGHGASPRARDACTIGDLAARLLDLLDGLGIPAAVVCGSSAGAMVAIHLAIGAPARVAGLVLLGAQARAETAESRARHVATLRMVERLGAAPVLRGLASVMFGETTRRGRPEAVGAWVERNALLDPSCMLPVVHAILSRQDATSLLPRVRCSALVIHGAEDALVSAEASAELAASLPRARLVTIGGAGHLATIEQPEEVARHMVAFLDGGTGDALTPERSGS